MPDTNAFMRARAEYQAEVEANPGGAFYDSISKLYVSLTDIDRIEWYYEGEWVSSLTELDDAGSFDKSEDIAVYLTDGRVCSYPTSRAKRNPETWEPLRAVVFPD
jgi:hypothetical protein